MEPKGGATWIVRQNSPVANTIGVIAMSFLSEIADEILKDQRRILRLEAALAELLEASSDAALMGKLEPSDALIVARKKAMAVLEAE